MAMVDVDNGNLTADSQPKLDVLVWVLVDWIWMVFGVVMGSVEDGYFTWR